MDESTLLVTLSTVIIIALVMINVVMYYDNKYNYTRKELLKNLVDSNKCSSENIKKVEPSNQKLYGFGTETSCRNTTYSDTYATIESKGSQLNYSNPFIMSNLQSSNLQFSPEFGDILIQ